jgi:hypothetical protein
MLTSTACSTRPACFGTFATEKLFIEALQCAMAMAFPIARIAARTTLVANKSQLQNEGISPEGTFPSRGDRDLRGEHADDLADNRRYARQRTEAVEPFT